MDTLDRVFNLLYAEFVEGGGLDATRSVDEDFERIQHQATYCVHACLKVRCAFCGPRPLLRGLSGYVPPPE